MCRLCREEPNEELYGKFFVEEGSGFSVHQYCMVRDVQKNLTINNDAVRKEKS